MECGYGDDVEEELTRAILVLLKDSKIKYKPPNAENPS